MKKVKILFEFGQRILGSNLENKESNEIQSVIKKYWNWILNFKKSKWRYLHSWVTYIIKEGCLVSIFNSFWQNTGHPPYLPDLSLSNFFSFPKLKIHLKYKILVIWGIVTYWPLTQLSIKEQVHPVENIRV